MSAVRVKFGEVVRKVNDKVDPGVDGIERFVAGDHMDTDEQKIFRFGNVGEGYLGPAFHMRFKPGHILYGSRRTYLRKVAMADFEGVCANTTFVIAPSDGRLDASYLLNVMSTERFHQNSISLSKGSTNPYINFSDLATFEFELPSIEEQQRIVELLSGVDAHAEALRNQLHVAKETRKAVRHHLLNARGDDWTETTLGEVSTVSYGYTDSASNEEVGPKFLRITDIQDSGVDWDSVPYCHIDIKQLQKQRLQDGDIVFARTGATTGKSFLVLNPPNAVCASYLIRLRPDPIKVIPPFLNLNFQTGSYWEQVKSGTTGSAQGGFNASKLTSLSLLLPAIEEQQRIVDEVSNIDAVIQETTSALAATRQLRSALLNKEIS